MVRLEDARTSVVAQDVLVPEDVEHHSGVGVIP